MHAQENRHTSLKRKHPLFWDLLWRSIEKEKQQCFIYSIFNSSSFIRSAMELKKNIQTSEILRRWDLMLFQLSMKATSDTFKADFVWISWWIFIAETIVRNIYFFGLFFSECLPSCQWENLSWTQLYFPSSSEMGEGRVGGKKGNFVEKKNGCGYQKDSAHLLRVLSKFLKAQRKGGFSHSSVTPPSLKLNPIEWEKWSDAETVRNKALTGLKQTPFCMTTNTSLGVLTVGNLRGGP